MKKTKRAEMRFEEIKSYKQAEIWLTLVHKYARDAPEELWAIYCKLTAQYPQQLPKTLEMSRNGDILSDASDVYIFIQTGTIRYGPECLGWPVGDESLWPWTAVDKQMPTLPKDVWGIIVDQLPINDGLALATVSRHLRNVVLRDEHWRRKLLQISEVVPCIGKLMRLKEGRPLWKSFAYIQWLAKHPANLLTIQMGIHLSMPHGIPFFAYWEDHNAGMGIPSVMRLYDWRRWLHFKADNYQFMIGRTGRNRNFEVLVQLPTGKIQRLQQRVGAPFFSEQLNRLLKCSPKNLKKSLFLASPISVFHEYFRK